MDKTRIDRNVVLLNACYEKHNDKFENKWNEAISLVTHVEYSTCSYINLLGYYAESILGGLIIDNFRRGIVSKTPIKKYNFKYYFDSNNRIIITERLYSDTELSEIFFHIYEDSVVYVLGYDYTISRELACLVRNEFDEQGRMIHHLYSRISSQCITEHVFHFTNTEMTISHAMYMTDDVVDEDTIKWEHDTFPIEWLNGRPESKFNAVSAKCIALRLKKNIELILQDISIYKPYAIMFILKDPKAIAIDFAVDNETNKGRISENRWNYSCWEHHSKPIWKNKKEIDQFNLWFEETAPQRNLEYVLDHQEFTSLFIDVIKEIKESIIYKLLPLKSALILVTDYEIYERVIEINESINHEHEIQDYLQWCKML